MARLKPQQGCLCSWYKPWGCRWWPWRYRFWRRYSTVPECPIHGAL